MIQGIRKLLGMHGVHYLVTRFGPQCLKLLAFDEKFHNGAWNFTNHPDYDLADVVKRYANKGNVLIMGCGTTSIMGCLEADGFSSVLGIDISSEAIRMASQYASPKVSFKQADMIHFKCPSSFNIILFPESLYYVSMPQRKALLQRFCASLKPEGCIIATFAQARRYARLLRMIRRNFHVLEDREFEAARRRLIVFRSSSPPPSPPVHA